MGTQSFRHFEPLLKIGLANRCVPDEELEIATLALARDILESSWHTLRADKMLVNEGQAFTLKEGLAFERAATPGSGPDLQQRLEAFAKN